MEWGVWGGWGWGHCGRVWIWGSMCVGCVQGGFSEGQWGGAGSSPRCAHAFRSIPPASPARPAPVALPPPRRRRASPTASATPTAERWSFGSAGASDPAPALGPWPYRPYVYIGPIGPMGPMYISVLSVLSVLSALERMPPHAYPSPSRYRPHPAAQLWPHSPSPHCYPIPPPILTPPSVLRAQLGGAGGARVEPERRGGGGRAGGALGGAGPRRGAGLHRGLLGVAQVCVRRRGGGVGGLAVR